MTHVDCDQFAEYFATQHRVLDIRECVIADVQGCQMSLWQNYCGKVVMWDPELLQRHQGAQVKKLQIVMA